MIGNVLNMLRRKEPQDAFSGEGDEFYDDDEAPENVGRKIALIVSGILFLGMIGLGVTVYLVGKDAPPPTQAMMPLTDLKVEDADSTVASTPADSSAAPTQIANAVDATDKSAQRRPWLTAPPAAAPQAAAKPGPSPTPPAPAAKGAPQAPAPAAPAALPAPPPAPVAKAQPQLTPPVPATPVPPVSKAPVAPPAAAPQTMPSILQTKPEAPAGTATADAGPAMPVDVAPGAPDRFTEKADLGINGRPHLTEPALPPVDRASMNAPPPRFGNIAVMRAKNAPPPTKINDKIGKVAVIVQGLGLSQDATEAAVSKLPSSVALSFSPYAHDLRKWLQQAKAGGHEVLVELPMESKQYPAEDPGPLGLMTSVQPKENAERLKTILKLFPGAIGVDDIMGTKFRESEDAMRDVFTSLKQGNLVYVQGRPGVRIGEPGVPNTIADVVLDERPFRAAIDARLDYAERLAKYQGSAVTVMDAKPVSFERLALWLDQIDKRGVQLTPVSQVLVTVAAAK